MIREIENKEIEELYQRFCKDFPFEERYELTLEHFRSQVEKWWEVSLYQEEDRDKAYCIGSQSKEYYLLIFFAVYDQYRGQGIGSRCIEELKKICKKKKGILIEVEDPAKSKNKEDKQTRERRIIFYERLGFSILENIEYELYGVPYKIMILDTKINIQHSLQEIKENLQTMYPLSKKKKTKKLRL